MGPGRAACAIECAGGAAQRLHMAAEQLLFLLGLKVELLRLRRAAQELVL